MNLDPPNPLSKPRLIIVCGRPGAGKTTLSLKLSKAISYPLLSRDEIYNGIKNNILVPDGRIDKVELNGLVLPIFFAAIAFFVSKGVSVVAEAAFQDHRWKKGLAEMYDKADIRYIHCDVDAETATSRIYKRKMCTDKSTAMLSSEIKMLQQAAPPSVREYVPLSLPVASLVVDTSNGYIPAFAEIVGFALAINVNDIDCREN